MRIRLENDRCVGHAQCFAVDEELFPVDDDGYSLVGVVEVGSAQEKQARRGVGACPEQALIIDE